MLTDLLRGQEMLNDNDSDYAECFLNFLNLRKSIMKEDQNECLEQLIV